jgi:hypothetical protein
MRSRMQVPLALIINPLLKTKTQDVAPHDHVTQHRLSHHPRQLCPSLGRDPHNEAT